MTTREILELVQIDLDHCSLTYGTGACDAVLGSTGTSKCFNTYKTCQSVENFAKTTKTLTFGKNQEGLPKGMTVFPCLNSVSTSATRINIAGVDLTLGSIGKRERITIKLSDFTYQDTFTDKYQSERRSGAAQSNGIGYEPASRGTFWGRLKARTPYYYGRPVRIIRGYVGDDVSAMRTTHYLVDSIDGPDASGNVTIVARDILSMAENDKAICPLTTTGKIDRDIDESEVDFDTFLGNVPIKFSLTPTGAGDDYGTSGVGIIGNELFRFTRTGDLITVDKRAIYGTTAENHEEGDTFQQCYEVTNTSLSNAIGNILRDFAGVPSEYIDQADWNLETERWLPGLKVRSLITKPTGVLTLLAELAQLGAALWWDAVNQKVRYRLNRLNDANDGYNLLSDAANILEGTISATDRPDLRVSQVLLYHSPLDFTASATSSDNYGVLQVSVDLEAEGANEYDQSQIRTFYSRWISDGSTAAAQTIASRALIRYRDIPTDISFDVDIKDIESVGVSSVCEIMSRVFTDATGAMVARGAQVTQFEETEPGHRASIVAQTFSLDGRYGFIRDDGSPNYSAATDEQKALGTWIAADEVGFTDGKTAYKMY